MDTTKPATALFDVFLRLRPSSATSCERFLDVERGDDVPTHITIKPPANDHRKRAIEKFAFTRVFEEHAGQRELFENTGVLSLIEGVLGVPGKEGRDGLLATLGVTGSGKSHTILGSKSQRGLTQLTLDVLYQHIGPSLADVHGSSSILSSIGDADVSEAQIQAAATFLDCAYGDTTPSRGATPALEASILSAPSSKKGLPRISSLPSYPPVQDVIISADTNAEYAIVISMFEVYNDRIYDLLTASAGTKAPNQRRVMLFKCTEASPERKVVAGLRKIVCSTMDEALLVLESGLHERKVAGTGSNATSSRSHGFFNIEVKKRRRSSVPQPWSSSVLSIVDLAGSERARTAKTTGSTLAEAGKINSSLMWLGQCMQMQSDNPANAIPKVPFRQCKLTELLFHNSFTQNARRPRQKAIMVVTADPLGDFNMTSQILRYSALAREVTVPRIPSVSSTILSDVGSRPGTADGPTGSSELQNQLHNALAEVARLRDALEITQINLEEETRRRQEAEESWRVATENLGDAESRIEQIEGDLREELCAEMELRLTQEMRRWKAARDAELDYQEEHVSRKLELYAQGVQVWEDEDKENVTQELDGVAKKANYAPGRVSDLEDENAQLRQRLAELDHEKTQSQVLQSPSKKMRVLKSRKWEGSGMGLDEIS